MSKMKRMKSKKSNSLLWNSSVSDNNSKLLAESLAEMDQSVKQVLKLMEDGEDVFAQKGPDLISHVEDFYRMYHDLAERYFEVTEDLRKKIKSALKHKKLAAGSDHSKKKKDGSSSSSSSSSDSDDDDSTEANIDGFSSALHQRILELENELSETKEKLRIQEDCEQTTNGINFDLKAKLSDADNKLKDCEAQISVLEKKLEESSAYLSSEREKVYKLEEQIESLHGEILSLESVNETRIAELEDLNTALNVEADKYRKETLSLSARNAELEGLLQEKSTLEDQVTTQSEEHVKNIQELNRKIEDLQANIDVVTAEKLEIDAKSNALIEELKGRDDKMSEMDQHLNRLHFQHLKMITENEASRRLNSELESRIKELEEEVAKQRDAVSESAEGKREAIRQLCFSIEHYRDRYDHLRQLLQGQKRFAIMSS